VLAHTVSFMGDPTTTRPAPTASSALAKTPFLHLLVYALEKGLTGSMELFAPDRSTATILFLDGQPAKARTSEPVAYLGRVLCDLHHLTEEQLSRSLEELTKVKADRPMLHGELLLSRGLIDAAKLRIGLDVQLARKLRCAASMPSETKYAYYDGFDALRGWGGEGERIDPVPLFWGMLLEYAPWEHVNAAFARISTSPVRVTRAADLERLGLKKEELAAAELLRARPMSAPDFASAAGLNHRTAQLLAYLLLMTKQVDVLPPPQVASTPPAPAGTDEARERTRSQSPSAGSSDAKERTRTATPSMGPSAAKPRSSSPTPPPRTTPAPTGPRRTTPPPTATAPKTTPSARAAQSAPPPPPPALSHELAERWREIIERAATIERADYFMMLDIARDATHDDVQSAFFLLVKRWHPDRLPPELAPIRDACSRVFSRMSEAHVTLTDDKQRARYMRLLADGSGSPEMQATVAKVVDAATNFQKAEVCFRRNDMVQAETFCRKALEDDPTQPDYHAMLAWLAALKPENHVPEKTIESIQMLERAIAMSDRCEKAYFWRGMLYKRLGRGDLAVRDFRRVIDLNPRNIDAAREVRLYNMRGGGRSSKPPAPIKRSIPSPPKPDEPARPGILGRLFKKP
jgi:DnaJ domain/Tetratricopeptide repeat